MNAVVDRIDGWFTAPCREGAGTYGLFRIVYGFFGLWFVAVFDPRVMPLVPRDEGTPWVARVGGLEPTETGWVVLDALLVAALVLLAAGLFTRPVTAVVLILGLAREGFLTGPNDVEAAHPPMVFWIPLLMLLFGRWGETWSLDALRRRRRGATVTNVHDDEWTHALAARTFLVLVVAFFVTSPLFKILSGGVWLENKRLLQNMLLDRSTLAAELGYWTSPVPSWIHQLWPSAFALQVFVLAFEATFFLVLLGPRIRNWYLATAVLFHAANALLLLVGFAPVLIVYALYVDWQRLADRVGARWPSSPEPRTAGTVAVVLAVVLGATWWTVGSHALFDLGGRLHFRSWFYVVGPIALVVSIRATVALVGGLRTDRRSLVSRPDRGSGVPVRGPSPKHPSRGGHSPDQPGVAGRSRPGNSADLAAGKSRRREVADDGRDERGELGGHFSAGASTGGRA